MHAQDLDAKLPAHARTGPDARLPAPPRTGTEGEGYGGWDGDGRQLTGHIAGHYLSGVSLHVCRDRRSTLQGARGLPGDD